ncbi:hypothetical protein QS257_18350 [Terrilactibacillus sp. S3-3]|nr:hypothetical protein QS257_18350 [Terrilactibacillus sp. S3-3]
MTVLLDYTAKAVATVLLRTQFIEEKILRHQNELIQDILKTGKLTTKSRLKCRWACGCRQNIFFIGGIVEMDHQMIGTSQEEIESKPLIRICSF